MDFIQPPRQVNIDVKIIQDNHGDLNNAFIDINHPVVSSNHIIRDRVQHSTEDPSKEYSDGRIVNKNICNYVFTMGNPFSRSLDFDAFYFLLVENDNAELLIGEALVGEGVREVAEVSQVTKVRDKRPGRELRDLSSAEAFAQSLNLPFEELELIKLIGGGGFGQVSQYLIYMCTYDGPMLNVFHCLV